MSKIINYGHLLPLVEVSDCFKNTSRTLISNPGWTYSSYDIVTNDLNEQLEIGQQYTINFNTVLKNIGDLPIKNLIFEVQMDYNFRIVYHGETTSSGKVIRFPSEIQFLNVDENESFQLLYTPSTSNNHLIRIGMYDGDREVCVKYFNVIMLKRYSTYSIASDVAGRYPCIPSILKSSNIFLNTSLIQEIGYENVRFNVRIHEIEGFNAPTWFTLVYNGTIYGISQGVVSINLGDIPYNWSGASIELRNYYGTKCAKWYYDMELIAGDGAILDSASFLAETYQDFPSYQFTNESYNDTKLIPGQEYTFHYILTSTDHQVHSDCDFGLRMTTNFGNFRVKYNNGSGNVVKSSSQGSIVLNNMRTLNGSTDFEFDIIFTYSTEKQEPIYHGVIFASEYCTGIEHTINRFSENFANAVESQLEFNFTNIPPDTVEYSEERFTFTGRITSIPNDYISKKTWYLRVKPLSDNQFSWSQTQIIYNSQTTLFNGEEIFLEIGRPNSELFSKDVTFSVLPLVNETTLASIQVDIGYYDDYGYFVATGNDSVRFAIEDNLPEYSEYNVWIEFENVQSVNIFDDFRFRFHFERTVKGKKDRVLEHLSIYAYCHQPVSQNDKIYTHLYNNYLINPYSHDRIINNIYLHPNFAVIDCEINNLHQKNVFPYFDNINLILNQDEFITDWFIAKAGIASVVYEFSGAYEISGTPRKIYTYRNHLSTNSTIPDFYLIANCESDHQQNIISVLCNLQGKPDAKLTIQLYNFTTGEYTKTIFQNQESVVYYVNTGRQNINDNLFALHIQLSGMSWSDTNNNLFVSSYDPTTIYNGYMNFTTTQRAWINFANITNKLNISQDYISRYCDGPDIIYYPPGSISLKLYNNDNLGFPSKFYVEVDDYVAYNKLKEIALQNFDADTVNSIVVKLLETNGTIKVNKNVLTEESIQKLNDLNWTISYYD